MAFRAVRKFELVADKFRQYPNNKITLPKRTTKSSAGYDICTPIAFMLKPGERITVKTDIKVSMYDDEMLIIIPRSSVGIKKGCVLSNTIGLIDADYYSNEYNDGNIHIALHNIGDEEVAFSAGERICQGVFIKYLAVENEPRIMKKRTGGIGSTGKVKVSGAYRNENKHYKNVNNTYKNKDKQVNSSITENKIKQNTVESVRYIDKNEANIDKYTSTYVRKPYTLKNNKFKAKQK